MLVLGRRERETITIGHDVEVTVVAIEGDKVRIGVSAPRSVPVHRREVAERIKTQMIFGDAKR